MCECVFVWGINNYVHIYVLYIYCIYNAGDYKLELYKSIRLEYKIYLYVCVYILYFNPEMETTQRKLKTIFVIVSRFGFSKFMT